MATTTETSYSVVSLEEAALAEEGDRTRVRLRRDLEIGSFGANAFRQAKAGEPLITEHDELGPGSNEHEELYVVVKGAATFTVDGAEVEAPHGTVVFVRDPAAKRKAIAAADGTLVLVVGGRPGEAFRRTPGEALAPFFQRYQDKDYEGALEVCSHVFEEEYPGNALALYNIACMESLLGRGDDALEHLRDAVDAWPRLRDNAREDDDFVSLREDPRFAAIVAEPE